MGLSGERWEQDVISELDSALNKWVDTIPDHRKCISLSLVAFRSDSFLVREFGGIKDKAIGRSLFSLRRCTLCTTSCRFRFTGR